MNERASRLRRRSGGRWRLLRRIHLFAGLLAGLHLTVLSVTGAVLVYRAELQKALHPHLFTASAPGPQVDPVAVLDAVAEAYPEGRISGVDAPTRSRETYLAYVVEEGGFRTVLVDPVTATPLGELPERSPVRLLQDLHFELFSGRTGRRVNGLGALMALILIGTGAALWRGGSPGSRERARPSVRRRERTLSRHRPRSRQGPPSQQRPPSRRRTLRTLHGMVGLGSLALLGMWALTGVYLAFPSQLRAAVGLVSPTAPPPPPRVEGGAPGEGPALTELLRIALDASPEEAWGPSGALQDGGTRSGAGGTHVARVILPAGEGSPLLVQFSRAFPREGSDPRLASVYLDPGSGEVLEVRGPEAASRGHALLRWIRPLHAGDVGHPLLKVLWFLGALAPPILFATGFRLWWVRGMGGRPR